MKNRQTFMPSKILFSLKWVWLLLVSLVSLVPCFLLLALIMTSIRDYFKPSCSTTTLPDPDGPLKEEIRPSMICDVNKIVSPLIGSAVVQTSSNASPLDQKRRPSTRFVIMSEFVNFFFVKMVIFLVSSKFCAVKITRYTVDKYATTAVYLLTGIWSTAEML